MNAGGVRGASVPLNGKSAGSREGGEAGDGVSSVGGPGEESETRGAPEGMGSEIEDGAGGMAW